MSQNISIPLCYYVSIPYICIKKERNNKTFKNFKKNIMTGIEQRNERKKQNQLEAFRQWRKASEYYQKIGDVKMEYICSKNASSFFDVVFFDNNNDLF